MSKAVLTLFDCVEHAFHQLLSQAKFLHELETRLQELEGRYVEKERFSMVQTGKQEDPEIFQPAFPHDGRHIET